MPLQQAVNKILVQLSLALDELSQSEYVRPCKTLFGSSIGQHVRHIIESYQCLGTGYEMEVVNYEKRSRDSVIEGNKQVACELLKEICTWINRENKNLQLEVGFDGHSSELFTLSTNYFREVAYNLEHSIHHMALIRIGISEISSVELPDDFGVASSTIKYRKQCAQ